MSQQQKSVMKCVIDVKTRENNWLLMVVRCVVTQTIHLSGEVFAVVW